MNLSDMGDSMKTFILATLILFASSIGFSKNAPKQIRTISLESSNTAFISEVITLTSLEKDVAHIMFKRATLPASETLYIVIHSGGGRVDAMYVLAAFIDKLPNTQLICDYCASAAGGIFELTSKRRLATSDSNMLMHEMYVMKVTARDLESEDIKTLKADSDAFNKIFYTKLQISKEKYEAKIAGTDWTVEGAELVKLKLADEIVRVECDEYMATVLPRICQRK